MTSLGEVFARYELPLDDSIARSAVKSVRINKQRRILYIEIICDSLIGRQTLFEAQKLISAADIGVDKVVIYPRFSPRRSRLRIPALTVLSTTLSWSVRAKTD